MHGKIGSELSAYTNISSNLGQQSQQALKPKADHCWAGWRRTQLPKTQCYSFINADTSQSKRLGTARPDTLPSLPPPHERSSPAMDAAHLVSVTMSGLCLILEKLTNPIEVTLLTPELLCSKLNLDRQQHTQPCVLNPPKGQHRLCPDSPRASPRRLGEVPRGGKKITENLGHASIQY